MQYEDVFRAALMEFPDAAVVSTCGHISRDLYNFDDRPGNFYLVGSMGMAAPVAAGIALADPNRTVVIFDGDGSFAMNPGGMLSVAAAGGRIVHIVLDNGVHGSTGGQVPIAFSDPMAAALAFGYHSAARVSGDKFDWASVRQQPALVHVVVQPRAVPVGHRVRHSPQQLRDRFQQFLLA